LAPSILNLGSNIFLPSPSMSNYNSQLTLHPDSHASDIGSLRWKENIARQIQNTECQIPETVRNRTHVHINFFFLRMTDTMTFQNIDLYSWRTLYNVGWYYDSWIGKKLEWSGRCLIVGLSLHVAWRDWGKPHITLMRTRYPGRDSKYAPTE
jgi:hypothetical protein